MSTLGLSMTLASEPWLATHRWQIAAALPPQWTELTARYMLVLGHKLELLGVKIDNAAELVKVCVYLERIRYVERKDGVGTGADRIRRHPMLI